MKRSSFASLSLLSWLVAHAAQARPGGGHTFSTGSDGGHGGGGDGHGGEELLFFVVRLIFLYPRVGVPVAVVAVIVVLVMMKKQKLADWDTPHHAHVSIIPTRGARAGGALLRDQLARLRVLDPDFSRVLFEDFAYRLFASVQRARPDAQALAALAPYLRDDVRTALVRDDLRAIENVVVAALRIERIELPETATQDVQDARVRIELSYEANMTLVFTPEEGRPSTVSSQRSTLYSRERWTLLRAADVRSKPPGSYERLGCPSCGAPFRSSDNRRCEYCGQVAGDGRFTFQLVERRVLSEQARPPSVGGYAEERGTDKPTLVAPDCEPRLAALLAKDPALSVPSFLARVRAIYDELNSAYGSNDLSRVRALVSDGMFDYLNYWIDAYRAQNLRNVLEQMQIERVDLAKVTEDRYFDAITVRVIAAGIDYTVEADSGKWLAGDRKHARRYTEYWTLIRGTQTRGAAKADGTCPNCAAPLKASMAGTCTHCSAHVTNGEFDWVLSKIEQDDVYDG
jgi:predicted lipid-binding transport protein (Tim44 family)